MKTKDVRLPNIMQSESDLGLLRQWLIEQGLKGIKLERLPGTVPYCPQDSERVVSCSVSVDRTVL